MSEREQRPFAAAVRLSSEIPGLDEIQRGELIEGSAYLVEGALGTAVARNIMLLRYIELKSETRPNVAIMKARQSRIDAKIREYCRTDEGVGIEAPFPHLERHPHRHDSS